ncbi:MAG: class I SAM-dependent methyltransferase [Paracoccaceae bacterium]
MNYNDLPGWFFPIDQAAFSWILQAQNRDEEPGALVDLGVYKGKSAVLMGNYLREGEVFSCCDLFEDLLESNELDAGERAFFARDLPTRRDFETTYLRFHKALPRVVQGPSRHILRFVAPASARFVHVDAARGYEQVRADLASAKVMLRPSGIVAVDGVLAPNSLGAAAALWDAVLNDGLKPFLNTPNKIYATWGDAARWAEPIRARADESGWCGIGETERIGAHAVQFLRRNP